MGEADDVLLSAAERALGATRRAWRRHRGVSDVDADPTGALLRLQWWLVACFGRSWPIVPCSRPAPAGWLRRALGTPAPWEIDPPAVAATDGACLWLPREMLGSEAGLLAALTLGRRLAEGAPSESLADPLQRDIHGALEAAKAEAWLAASLPGLAPSLDRARAAALRARPPLGQLRGTERAVEELVRSLLRDPASARDRDACARIDRADPDYRGVAPVAHWGLVRDPDPGGEARADRERRDGAAPGRGRVRRLTEPIRRRSSTDEPTRAGPFIVPPSDPHLAIQDARGVDRPRDRGEEDLDALADELARFDELSTVRSEEGVREVLQRADGLRDAVADPDPTPLAVAALTYPEWDFRSRTYRGPGVALREGPVRGSDPGWADRALQRHGALVIALRRQFAALRPRFERQSRQIEGDEIDVDEWVGERAEQLAGRSPGGRLYRCARRRRRDLAVVLLVDASGSTDSWVSSDQRVIDVAKEAALCFSEALSAVGDRHAIYAFSGQGAGDVRVWVAKRFADPLDAAVRARIGAVAPDRSTRLGGPIRHATAALTRISAQRRILLVLSDGKPNDEDVYEGEYGIEDVRQALHEAAAAGVRSFCVTIDRRASSYLPRLFGATGYTLLWDASQLPARLPQIYRHLTPPASA